MVARNLVRLCTLLYILFVLYYLAPTVCRFLDWAWQTNPWSGQKWVEQAWIPTDAELQCLNGSYHSHSFLGSDSEHQQSPSPSRTPIPNIVHFNFGLKSPLSDRSTRHFGFLNYLAIRAALLSLSPDRTYLHYTYLSSPPSSDPSDSPLSNHWVRRLVRQGLRLIHHPPSPNQSDKYAHLSDTLRLESLLSQGGIYLDVDAFALRPFDSLLSKTSPDAILGHEGGNRWGLCNAVIVSRPNSTFLTRWLASYETADLSSEWNYHSVRLPKLLADNSSTGPEGKEVCTLPPDAFFWPTWTWRHVDWMHSPLSKKETREWEDKIELNGGSLFKNQLAYHSWSQMAWDRHLRWLTPEVVRNRNTRFNLLARRFLEDDL